MAVSVRKATTEDADVLFGLVKAYATSFIPNFDAFQESLKHLLDDESAWLSVAESEGALVGYMLGFDHYTLYANGRVSWIEELMVDEQHRRQGVGRVLMDEFDRWARSRGSMLVGVATRRAAQFYSALGYKESAGYFSRLL